MSFDNSPFIITGAVSSTKSRRKMAGQVSLIKKRLHEGGVLMNCWYFWFKRLSKHQGTKL
jgi:hypothetical protein